jgi:hypothetical protein
MADSVNLVVEISDEFYKWLVNSSSEEKHGNIYNCQPPVYTDFKTLGNFTKLRANS